MRGIDQWQIVRMSFAKENKTEKWQKFFVEISGISTVYCCCCIDGSILQTHSLIMFCTFSSQTSGQVAILHFSQPLSSLLVLLRKISIYFIWSFTPSCYQHATLPPLLTLIITWSVTLHQSSHWEYDRFWLCMFFDFIMDAAVDDMFDNDICSCYWWLEQSAVPWLKVKL